MLTLVLMTVAIFGLILGSFLNVCIYRLPRGESIVHPRSRCPSCHHQLSWYENIPLLSYLVLRGRCRYCGRPISPRYFVVELLTAVLSVAVWMRFSDPMAYVAYFVLLSAPLLVMTFIDLEHFLIPDVMTIPGIILGVAVHYALSPQPWIVPVLESLLGIVLGGGSLWLLSWLYEKWRGRVGLGLGDVKLAAMLGAFLGWRPIIFILFVSSIIGTLVGLVVIVAGRRRLSQPLPYGPFLAVATWTYLFVGPELLTWYFETASGLFHQ